MKMRLLSVLACFLVSSIAYSQQKKEIQLGYQNYSLGLQYLQDFDRFTGRIGVSTYRSSLFLSSYNRTVLSQETSNIFFLGTDLKGFNLNLGIQREFGKRNITPIVYTDLLYARSGPRLKPFEWQFCGNIADGYSEFYGYNRSEMIGVNVGLGLKLKVSERVSIQSGFSITTFAMVLKYENERRSASGVYLQLPNQLSIGYKF
jgi:hypothetical protein